MVKKCAILFALLVTLVLPALAFGQEAGGVGSYFTPAKDDQSLIFLGRVVGKLGINPKTEQEIPQLNDMFRVFNHVILIFGVFVVMYTTIIATLNTAHQGKFLGERFSSLWVPIRTVLGIGLLLPTAKGYALIQTLVMWLVVMSVGAADNIWEQMVLKMNLDGAAVTASQPSTEIEVNRKDVLLKVIRPMVLGMICAKQQGNAIVSGPGFRTRNPETSFQVNFNGDLFTRGECGYIEIEANDATEMAERQALESERLRNNTTDREMTIFEAKKAAIISMQKDLKKFVTFITDEKNYRSGMSSKCVVTRLIGDKPVENCTPATDAFLTEAAAPVTNAMMTYITKVKTAQEGVIRRLIVENRGKTLTVRELTEQAGARQGGINTVDLVAEGWLYAGSYYNLLAQRSAQAASQGNLNVDVSFRTWCPGGVCKINPSQITKEFKSWYDFTNSPLNDVDARIVVVTLFGLDQAVDCLDNTNCKVLNSARTIANRTGGATAGYVTIGENYMKQMAEYSIRGNYTSGEIDILIIPKNIWNDSMRDFFRMTQRLDDDANNAPIAELIKYGQETASSLGNLVSNILIGFTVAGALDIVTLGTAEGASAYSSSTAGGMMAPGSNLAAAFIASAMYAINTAIKIPTAIIAAQMPLAIAIASIYFVQGAMLGIYVPLIPFVMFTFGALGWMIMVLEALVAAPIVALGATIPEGNEIYGKAVPALMLVSNIFLRPMLMLFGLAMGVLLANVGIEFFTRGFSIVFMQNFTGGGGPPNIFYWTVIVFIYSSLIVFLLQKCFSMISALPERVLRWIGDTSQGISGGEEALGELRGATQRGGETGAQQAGEAQRGHQAGVQAGGQAAAEGQARFTKSLENFKNAGGDGGGAEDTGQK